MSTIKQLEQADFFGVTVVSCSRCGLPCRVATASSPDARLLKRAVTPVKNGLCGECAMAGFIQSVETLMYGIQKNGLDMLRDPRVQAEFEIVMQAGQSDAEPGEIRWERVISNWDLPFPKRRKGRR